MPQVPAIQLRQPIAAASVLDPASLRRADGGPGSKSGVTTLRIRDGEPNPQSPALGSDLQEQKDELDRRLALVQGLADNLRRLYEETLASNRVEIAKLAVEISRRILMRKISQGDYEIQAIVAEALKQAPTRQNVVIRVNPEDLARCQELQQQDPQSPFADLELAADWSIGRGECLVETPQGIVPSFLEQHLERIGEALQKVK
jgi:flagellar biosynthesis/type III secretory pathway protein FliH